MLREIHQIYSNICYYYYGKLRETNTPKKLCEQRVPEWIVKIKKKYRHKYFHQCLITGRCGQTIEEKDLHKYGISAEDANAGGLYPPKDNRPDRLREILFEASSIASKIIRRAAGTDGPTWQERYYEYLQSEEWHNKRISVLERDRHACVLSGRRDKLQIHHLTYDRVGCEELSDLVTLNKTVHYAIHDKDKYWNSMMERYLS